MEARWTPGSPEERNYYDQLFMLADPSNMGRLAGQSAVGFLGKSGLPFPILKEIWDLSAVPSLNYLRSEDFYVAMRLIAMAQASPGGSISADRLMQESSRPLPLARMQGVPPPPEGVTSQGLAHEPTLAPDPYTMSSPERSQYESIFPMYDSDRDGFVTGAEAVELFSKSRLPREQLRQIWQLADADGDSKLSMAEFCVGMHLIVCVSKKGLPCPATRPPSLFPGSGSASGAVKNPAQSSGGSPETSVPPSSVGRPSPSMQQRPPPAMLPRGPETSSSQDVFSALAMDLPAKDALSSSASNPEVRAIAPEQGPPVVEHSLRATPPQSTKASSSPRGTATSEKDTPLGSSNTIMPNQPTSTGTPVGMQELRAASSALLSVARDVSTVHNQAVMAQSSNLESTKVLVEQLQAEKASLTAIVEAGRAEYMDNEQKLRDMEAEIKNLGLELETLRVKFQEQQKESIELRGRLARATVGRATLQADVMACDASVHTLKDGNEFLRTMLGERGPSEETVSTPQPEGVDKNGGSPSQASEHVQTAPEARDVEAKVDAPEEPDMPVKTPPPPPNGMVPKLALEDPFADVVADEVSGNGNTSVSHGLDPKPQEFNNDEGEQGGFDAFPGGGFGNGSDPFAITTVSGDGVEETADDPFKATDAVFTNATAAADDGFDAFPSSAGAQQVDAFGQ